MCERNKNVDGLRNGRFLVLDFVRRFQLPWGIFCIILRINRLPRLNSTTIFFFVLFLLLVSLMHWCACVCTYLYLFVCMRGAKLQIIGLEISYSHCQIELINANAMQCNTIRLRLQNGKQIECSTFHLASIYLFLPLPFSRPICLFIFVLTRMPSLFSY